MGTTRTVPLHEHVLAQDFMAFAKAGGKSPLFYNAPKASAVNNFHFVMRVSGNISNQYNP